MLLDHFGEVSAVAEFGDDAGVRLEGYDFVQSDDVFLVGERLEDVDFVGEQCLVDLSFDVLHVDELEGDGLAGRVVAAAVDDARVALAYDVLGNVGVLTDLATHLGQVL